MAQARVKWIEEKTYLGTDANGRPVVISAGSDGPGAGPMQLLLLGLGGCTSIDVVSILHKSRQQLVDCEVEIEAERASGIPAVFTKIHLHFIVSGKDIDPDKVRKAVDLSADKYCSASKMLEKAAEISHDFEVINLS